MIWNKLQLEYFKCFEKLALPLANLTLLSGVNSSGKSTVLQTLALLNQTAIDNEWSHSLLLNGSTLSLGTVGEVIDKNKARHQAATIEIETDKYKCTWRCLSEDRSSYTIPFEEVTLLDFADNQKHRCVIDQPNIVIHRLLPETLSAKLPISDLKDKIYQLTYLGAERLGPRETYQFKTSDRHDTVGSHGEYTPWYLFAHREADVCEPLRITKNTKKLPHQTEAYMKLFFPGVSIRVEKVKNVNLITLGIKTSAEGDYHHPQNVGYGITHILPIITACLGANVGDIILIENPEVHLHPAAQASIGLFLAKVAAAGIQVIVETHSDHVLNGIRRATKEKILTPEEVAIYFFRPREVAELQELPQVQEMLIDPEGLLDDWPTDFFDQFHKDSAYFAGWEL
jgi:predicted ATPase